MAHNKFRFPNQGARELNELTSWNTISTGLNNARNNTRRLGASFGEIQSAREGREEIRYRQFTAGIGGMRGTIGGDAGQKVDEAITSYLKSLKSSGGHKIGNYELSKATGDLQTKIESIASALGGVQGNILKDFSKTLKDAKTAASKGGINAVTGSGKDAIKTAFGLKADNSIEEARKKIADEITQAAKSLSTQALRQSVTQVVEEMNRLSSAAKTSAEKQKILADAQTKLAEIRGGATGADKAVMEDIVKSTHKNTSELNKDLLGQAANRKGLEFNNRLAALTNAIGIATRSLIPIKRTLDVSNALFQSVNSKFNQFARMQMQISAERGGFGRQVRGAGINYGHMMAAIGAGRSAGMEDRQVVGQMVGLQTQLAQARWGEGGLAENVGRWGISVYNGAGGVKQAHEVMIEFSRKLRSLGSDMEKLQFLHAIGRSPEEMEYVANYEKNAQRMEWLKKNPHMMGVLDRADILDASGFNAKADAATKIELRRREILNQNAMEQGPFEALKRSLNPENWLFSDWTARQKGVQQARGEIAMERLTRAINEKIRQDEKNSKKSDVVTAALATLNQQDVAAISSIMQKDIDDKGDKSTYSQILKSFEDQFGLAFDVRTPIEKLQAALVPITNKVAEWAEGIYKWLTKSKTANYIKDNPGKSLAIAGGGVLGSILGSLALFNLIRHPFKSANNIKGLWNFGKGIFTTPVFTGASSSIAPASAASSKPGIFSRMWGGIKGWFGSKKSSPQSAMQTVPGGLPDANGRYNLDATVQAVREEFKNGAKAVSQTATMTSAATAGTSGVGGKVLSGLKGTGARGLAGLKGITRGNVVTNVIWSTPELLEAGGEYFRGNTKTANNKLGSTLGGLGGGMAGAAIGAGIGSVIPVVGTAIGGILGGIIGHYGGKMLGGGIGDVASWAFGAEDSRGKEEQPSDKHEIALSDGEKYIKEIRDLVKSNDGIIKAQKSLAEKGIHIEEGVLKSQDFMHNDQFAGQTIQTAILMKELGAYAAKTGKAISAEEYARRTEQDPYLMAARNSGIKETAQDRLAAATGGRGYTREVVENYMAKGGLTNERIGFHSQKVREEHSDWTAGQVLEEAKKRAAEEHTKKLTQTDYENEMDAIIEEQKALLKGRDAAELVAERAEYERIRESGAEKDGYFYGRLKDGSVGRLNDKGNWIYDSGNEVEDEQGNPIHARDITDEDRKNRDRMMQILQKNPDITDVKTYEAAKLLSSSPEAQQEFALREMQKRGIDVSNRTEAQKFKSEQAAGFEKFRRENQHLGLAEAISTYSYQTDISKDALRNLVGYGKTDEELTEEEKKEKQKGSKYRAEEKKKEAEERRAARKAERETAAKNVTEEEAAQYLGDEGDAAAYIRLRNRVEGGATLDEKEQNAYDKFTDIVGRKAGRARRAKEYTPLNAPYKPTKEEQADIDAADKESARLVRIKERTKNRRPLAEYSDLRYMGSLIKRGGIADNDKELEKNFGKQRVQQFRRAEQNGTLDHLMKGDHYKEVEDQKKRKPQMTREAAEAAYREMAEANVKRKDGESDADYKKRVDEQVASNMELYDTLHPRKKGKQAEKGKGTNKAAPAADAATAAMESAQTKTEQASQKMAEKGAAAENAAASAKEATSAGAGSHEQNITINMGGQTITQNIQGEKAMDAEGMKKGTVQGASEIRDKTAETIVSVTKSMGSY